MLADIIRLQDETMCLGFYFPTKGVAEFKF